MTKPNLDKTVQKFIDYIESKNSKPLNEITPDEAREFLSELQKEYYAPINAHTEDITIFSPSAGDINVRIVRPEDCLNEKLPVIIYCHGGGWVMGDADVYDMTIKKIANYTKSAVAFVNYPRSPEFKYPDALNQIYATIKYFAEYGSDNNIDTNKIAIAGDSAGGNLAIAAAIKAKFENGPKLLFQALIYPVADTEMNTESYKEFKDGPWLTKKSMEYFFDCYKPKKEIKENDMFISPLKAELQDLEDLPPTLIITAENDVLRDEGEALARKLIEANVDTACVRINNTIHDFMLLNALKESKATKAGYKILCRFLGHALNNN